MRCHSFSFSLLCLSFRFHFLFFLLPTLKRHRSCFSSSCCSFSSRSSACVLLSPKLSSLRSFVSSISSFDDAFSCFLCSGFVFSNPKTFWMTTGMYPQEIVISLKNQVQILRARTVTYNVKRLQLWKSNDTRLGGATTGGTGGASEDNGFKLVLEVDLNNRQQQVFIHLFAHTASLSRFRSPPFPPTQLAVPLRLSFSHQTPALVLLTLFALFPAAFFLALRSSLIHCCFVLFLLFCRYVLFHSE